MASPQSPANEMKNTRLSALLMSLLCMAAPALASHGFAKSSGDPGGIFVKDRLVPDLELPTIDGRSTVNLGSLEGRKVIVLQFASW